jgi:hypothetical protein
MLRSILFLEEPFFCSRKFPIMRDSKKGIRTVTRVTAGYYPSDTTRRKRLFPT